MKHSSLILSLLLVTAGCAAGDDQAPVDMADYEADNAQKLADNNLPFPPGVVVEVTSGLQPGATGAVLVTMSSKRSIADLEAWYKTALKTKGYDVAGPTLSQGQRQLSADSPSGPITVRFMAQPDGSTNIALSTKR